MYALTLQQLRTWFRWKATRASQIGGRGRRVKGPELDIDFKDKSRTLKDVEVYSKLHYEEKIKPRTRELMDELISKNNGKLPPGGSINCIRKATNEYYAGEESEGDVMDEVRDKKAEDAEAKQKAREAANSDADPTPEEYARHVIDVNGSLA